ncbi:MAG: adenylyl-sulfate kinase [Verrucomicrobia bacterium]|nr:adenylyl-sulfate kinase [Verrucomicrobiota bacterium]
MSPTRLQKEALLRQKAHVVWLFGLSGAGKTTLANHLAAGLHARGILSAQLDGDDIRAGLSQGLGFSDADRTENLRRAAEVARLMANSGNVVLCSFITPFRTQRDLVRRIIGDSDLSVVHVAATLDICMQRDPKGLYSQAKAGRLPGLTGYEARFEEPAKSETPLSVNTVDRTTEDCTGELLRALLPVIRPAA